MVRLIKTPTIIQAQGALPKGIEEFVGRVNTGTAEVSVARMKSPAGWSEPGQRPGFTEYTVVLQGMLRVTANGQPVDVRAGESVIVEQGEWVQYSTPAGGGAEYISVCVPAFSPETVHRDGT